MNNFLEKRRKIILVAIIILAAFLIFGRLNRTDIQQDDAFYSFRAIGYVDFTDSNLQTTPFNWFDDPPFWTKLSFHDHPPLVFFIQHLFFKTFGVNDFTARLPFALAGVGSVFLLYLLVKKLYNVKLALISALILTFSSYHSWTSKIGYFEIIALFFILLTFYLFLLGLENPKRFIWFGISLGLTLLTKYTTFFVLPVIFLYVLLKDKKLFGSKYFILSIIIAILIFSPVIIYNFEMYQARGHFDLQLAGLFNQDMSDWPGMSGGGVSSNFLFHMLDSYKNLYNFYSLPIYLLAIFSLIYIIVNLFFNLKKKKNIFIILILLFLTIQFSFLGADVRLISLFNPFLAIVIALGLVNVYKYLPNKPFIKKVVYPVLLIIIFSFEMFYNLNTNIFYQPVGLASKHYSSYRRENFGFQNLENYLIKEGNIDKSKTNSLSKKDDLVVNISTDLQGKNIFLYDPNLRWFSILWYFRRIDVYNQEFFISPVDLALVIPSEDWLNTFQQNGVKNMYYIHGINELAFDPGYKSAKNRKSASEFEKSLSMMEAEVKEIYNINNQLSFKVYKLKLND